MKEVNLIIKCCYTCQICGIEFETAKYYKIIPNQFPICSKKCFFKLTYRILSHYSEENIIYLQKHFNIEENKENTPQKVLFLITKKYIKLLDTDDKIKLTHYSKPNLSNLSI